MGEEKNQKLPKVLENRLKENSDKARKQTVVSVLEPCPVCEGKLKKDEDCEGCSGTGIFSKNLTISEFKELLEN